MKKKILIVDDELEILSLLSARLKYNNYEVIVAHDGNECVKVALKEVPDLILLDIKMPKGGGFRAFERLTRIETTRHIPIIFMTAYPESQVINQFNNLEPAGYISKPIISKDFVQTIKTTLSQRKLQDPATI